MATNNFPGIGYTIHGRDFNFFQKVTVTWPSFGSNSVSGQQPDLIITCPTQGIIVINEDTSSIVQVSFNGQTVHEEINPTIVPGFAYDNRVISKIWFKLISGSSAVVSIRAWGTR